MDKLHFPVRNEFDKILKSRVDNYIKDNNLKYNGTKMLHIKGIISFVTVLLCYYLLVFQCTNPFMALAITFILIQGNILLAFNVMHDSNHGSFSSKKWLNNVASYTMEFLGSSSMLWRHKHNSLHHTYTNISGKDDDLDAGGMIRLSPEQEHKPWHRYQHIYAPFLYGFLSLYLMFYTDFERMITKKVGDMVLPAYTKKEIFIFIFSKTAYFFVFLILPMFFHPILIVLAYFIFAQLIFGFTLSVIFQLAHTVVQTDFPQADENNNLPFSWVEHQLHTTANFAPKNWFVTFYCGGLNYQVEHHLFHRISHVHYPKLSPIIKATCEEFNRPYHVSPTFWQALKSHFRFLKQLSV